jgi:hypothetical protein
MRSLRALLLIPLAASVARADEGAERAFTWRPSFETRSVLTDNAFLTSSHKDTDLGIWMEPRLELDYRVPALQLGADLGAQVPRYVDHTSLNDAYWRTNVYGEAGLWPGLSVRLSDAYTPQPIALGMPDDSTTNLAQTNRAQGEIRYWRELPGGREMTVGILGARFDGQKVAALVPGSDGDAVADQNFRPDFSEGGGFAEFRNPFGEDHALLVRGGTRYRSFDSLSEGEYLDAEGTVGLESRLPGGFDLALAGGFGWLDPRGGSGEPQALGRAELGWRHESGLRVQLGFHHAIASDLVGNDFIDTTGRLTLEKYFGLQTSATVTAFVSELDAQSAHPGNHLFGGAEVVVRRQLSRAFQISVAYRYWENDGGFETDDFRANQVSMAFSYRH